MFHNSRLAALVLSLTGALIIPSVMMAAALADAPIRLKVVDGGIPASLTTTMGDVAAGKAVFLNRTQGNCYACHQLGLLKDQPFPGEVGPALDGVGGQLSLQQLRLVVANAKLMFPGTTMPAFYKNDGFNRVADKFADKPMLTAQQVEDVVAFLASLK